MSKLALLYPLPSQATVLSAINDLISDLNLLLALSFNISLSDGAIAIGTDTTKVKSAATISYKVGGVFYSKGATDDLWTISGPIIPSARMASYALCLDASGVASIVASPPIGSGGTDVPKFPAVPSTKTVVGMIEVANASGVDFIPGTTPLNQGGVTTTYFDGTPAAVFALKTQV